MARRGLTARIRPGIELNEIRVKLPKFGPPSIELHGAVDTKDKRVGNASRAQILTMHMTKEGEAFIESMKDAFADTESSEAAKDTTDTTR